MDKTGIEKRFGITPSQWCDRASLVGDRSDGIPGVRGVGSITAARLLEGGLTLEELPGSGRLQGKLGARIRQQWSDLERWKSLAQLRKDLDVAPPSGTASPELPPAPKVLETLDLW
ncbi:5'-3' exonuclease H3TH domain-containing protein [Tenggerimyces flavus]|uniref:5'-3' exonuclease H3TH domain-containing protein n=1 Tax=Tenggerimyces flavus TaxID=1708749 RepID=A0ABV7YLW6_9ACTN